jgi:hypothetical protein
MLKKLIAVSLLATFATGCASGTVAQRRAEWNAPASVADQKFVVDESECDKRASDKSRGLAISSGVIGGLGFIFWPLLVPGIALGISAATTSAGTRANCMNERGYSKDGSAQPAPAALESREKLAPPPAPVAAPAPAPVAPVPPAPPALETPPPPVKAAVPVKHAEVPTTLTCPTGYVFSNDKVSCK